MGRTIRICKAGLLLAASAIAMPVNASSEAEDLRAMADYAAARVADIENRQDSALEGYLKLHRKTPQSAVLTDRLFETAIRKGDMVTAVRAARAQELQSASSDIAPLLFFADAFRAKNWNLARVASQELSQEGRFSFMASMLDAWVNVAEKKPHGLAPVNATQTPFLAYYSNDQRVYLDLATGRMKEARSGMQQLAEDDLDYVRDLLIRAAPVIAATGDAEYANALQEVGLGGDSTSITATPAAQKSRTKLTASEGLAALYVRVATSLLDQNVANDGLVLARLAYWLAPDFDPARLVLARALDDQGLGDEASKLRGAIALSSPYWTRSISQQVDALSGEGKEGEALAVAERAAARFPQSSRFLLLVGRSQALTDDFAAASKSYGQLVQLAEGAGYSPRNRATYRLLLASALDEGGNWASARENLEKAMTLDPNNAQILNYLGYSLLERKEDIPRGTSLVERAYKQSPDSAAITDSLGWAKYLAGDYAGALQLIEKAAEKSGNDAAINEHLGDAYWRSGRKVDARYAWRVASQTADDEAALRLANKIDIGLPDHAN